MTSIPGPKENRPSRTSLASGRSERSRWTDTTAANFALAVPITLAFSLASAGEVHLSAGGALLATASGAVASAIGYVLWYTIVPVLGAPRAAALQLAVPPLVPLGAAALLGEPLTLRLFLSGTTILAGVALAIAPRGRRPPR